MFLCLSFFFLYFKGVHARESFCEKKRKYKGFLVICQCGGQIGTIDYQNGLGIICFTNVRLARVTPILNTLFKEPVNVVTELTDEDRKTDFANVFSSIADMRIVNITPTHGEYHFLQFDVDDNNTTYKKPLVIKECIMQPQGGENSNAVEHSFNNQTECINDNSFILESYNPNKSPESEPSNSRIVLPDKILPIIDPFAEPIAPELSSYNHNLELSNSQVFQSNLFNFAVATDFSASETLKNDSEINTLTVKDIEIIRKMVSEEFERTLLHNSDAMEIEDYN